MVLFRRKKPEGETSNGESDQSGDGKKGNWKKPANTAFKQQRLKAWQPILTPKTVLPTFFALGILFAPIGVLLIWGSGLVSQITIDYTNCDNQPSQSPNSTSLSFTNVESYDYSLKAGGAKGPSAAPQWAFVENNSTNDASIAKSCFLQFEIPEDLDHSVFIYYKLTNFYQNHRRYVKSLDTNQLKGKAPNVKGLGDCAPLASVGDKPIYPCGLIANSIFNDTIGNPQTLDSSNNPTGTYNFTSDGIAWPGEKKKYSQNSGYANFSDIVPPPNWMARYPNNYTDEHPPPDLQADEHFQNWMRTAGLPTFTKLYGRNDQDSMKQGTYRIQIFMNFPVKNYSGTKAIVISTVSWVGGKNPFLGWAYVGTSVLLIVLGFAGTARHCFKPRRLGDMTQLSWNQPGAR